MSVKFLKGVIGFRLNYNKYLKAVKLKSYSTNILPDEINLDLQKYVNFKKHLKNTKIPFKDGYTCLQLECRLCNKQKANKYAFINKRTGCFMCPECDIKYSLNEVMPAYETGIVKQVQENCYQTKFSNQIAVNEEACTSLNIKGVQAKHLTALGAKYEPNLKLIIFPLYNAAFKFVGEKSIHVLNKTEETYENSASGILMFGHINKNKAILVNNLLDYISLSSLNLEHHCIVCLPYALKSVPQECLPSLERFKELVFWFKFDSADWDSSITFSNKMDDKRCLLIRPTDTAPCPYEAIRKKLNVRHILERAMPVLHKSITTFHSLRNDVLSELQNIEKVNGVKWKRFPMLNKLLKGHRKGELTIITGPTGSGKTTFMSEYSLDLAIQGVSTLWGSFEIRNTRLASTLLRQYVGYSLETKLNEFDHWATQFEKYPLYFMTFHGQQPIKVVMDAIEHAHYVHDIHHVIIDNLQFMMGIATSVRHDKFWEQDAIIASFRSFATKHNVHVTLVMHPRKERQEDDLTASSIFGTAKATQEADNVLIIQDKRLTALRGKKYLQIVKNRYSGDLGIMPLEFDKEALSYASNRKKKPNNVPTT